MSEGRERERNATSVRLAQAHRDTALARLSTLTRWSVIGAAVLTGVFATAAARAFPGTSNHAATSKHARAPRRASAGDSAGSESALQAPLQAPVPAASPIVVSGGS